MDFLTKLLGISLQKKCPLKYFNFSSKYLGANWKFIWNKIFFKTIFFIYILLKEHCEVALTDAQSQIFICDPQIWSLVPYLLGHMVLAFVAIKFVWVCKIGYLRSADYVAKWIRHQTSDLGIAGSNPVMDQGNIKCLVHYNFQLLCFRFCTLMLPAVLRSGAEWRSESVLLTFFTFGFP